jgi:uncharacterized protein YndB with AHSA1/START domain
MSVTSVDADYDNLTITLIAEFEASIGQVWELWSDPRRLERWLGPPTHPATVESHDLTTGGEVSFSMTGPDVDTSRGIWRFAAVDPPSSLEFIDSFADADGAPSADLPASRVRVRLTEGDGGTRMEMATTFESREGMQRRLDMGEVEGVRAAVGQMDALLEQPR